MQKQKKPKTRNPFVQHLLNRKSGSHTKPYKIERREAKAALKKDYLYKLVVSISSLWTLS